MSCTLNSLFEKAWDENSGEDTPITHTIYEVTDQENELEKICDFQASSVSSIYYSYDGKKAILSAYQVNGDSGDGIYEISLEDGKINTILNDNILADNEESIVCELANPNIAKFSKDEELIYFIGISNDSKETDIGGLTDKLAAIFSYNISSKEIKKVYEPKEASFIFDLNVKY